MEMNTLEIKEQTEVFGFTSIGELVNATLQNNFGTRKSGKVTSTGFKKLDSVIGGFNNGELTTIAVKPGMGKTAFLLSVANNLAIKNNYSLALFTAERSSQKITSRLIETETGMSVDKVLNSNLKASERDHLQSLIGNIAKAKIFIDDTQLLQVEELGKKAIQLKESCQIDLIIIDYLELLTTNRLAQESRHEQLSFILSSLKLLALQLDMPILLFSQFGATGSYLQQPAAGDLPEYLAGFSDTLMILHRSDLVNEGRNGKGEDVAELLVLKNSFESPVLSVPVTYINSISKFVD